MLNVFLVSVLRCGVDLGVGDIIATKRRWRTTNDMSRTFNLWRIEVLCFHFSLFSLISCFYCELHHGNRWQSYGDVLYKTSEKMNDSTIIDCKNRTHSAPRLFVNKQVPFIVRVFLWMPFMLEDAIGWLAFRTTGRCQFWHTTVNETRIHINKSVAMIDIKPLRVYHCQFFMYRRHFNAKSLLINRCQFENGSLHIVLLLLWLVE